MVDFAYANLLRSLGETICERDKRHAGLLHSLGDPCVTFQRTTSTLKEKTLDRDLHVSF